MIGNREAISRLRLSQADHFTDCATAFFDDSGAELENAIVHRLFPLHTQKSWNDRFHHSSPEAGIVDKT